MVKVNKNINYLIVCYFILLQTTFLGSGGILAITAIVFTTLSIHRGYLSRSTFKYSIPLLFIFLISFFSSLYKVTELNLYIFSKDILYLLNPIFYLFVGSLLYSLINDYKCFLKLLFVSIFIISLINLLQGLSQPSIFLDVSLKNRYKLDVSNVYAGIALVFLLYSKNVHDNFFVRPSSSWKYLIIAILVFSFLVSFSRVFYGAIFLMLLIPYIKNMRLIYLIYFFFVFLVFFIMYGSEILPDGRGATDGFIDKFLLSLNEMTVRQYDELSLIHQNWRGYEAYLGLVKFEEGNALEIIFGQGLGSGVVTPLRIFNGVKLDYLPFFHNGFITILLKSGFIGLFTFFLFLLKFLRYSFTVNPKLPLEKIAVYILRGIVFFLIIYTFAAHGIYKTDGPWIILILLSGTLKYLNDSNTSPHNLRNKI